MSGRALALTGSRATTRAEPLGGVTGQLATETLMLSVATRGDGIEIREISMDARYNAIWRRCVRASVGARAGTARGRADMPPGGSESGHPTLSSPQSARNTLGTTATGFAVVALAAAQHLYCPRASPAWSAADHANSRDAVAPRSPRRCGWPGVERRSTQ